MHPMVEAGMVGLRVRDDKLVGTLVACKDADAGFTDPARVHECDELEEERGLLLEEVRGLLFHRGFELIGVVTRNAVPSLKEKEKKGGGRGGGGGSQWCL